MNRNNKMLGRAVFFASIVVILFVGIVLSNCFAVVIDGLFGGFENVLLQIREMPYLLYLAISLVLSAVLTLILSGGKSL